MRNVLFALTAVSGLAMASSAIAMPEFDMVRDTVKKFLIELSLPTDNIDNLTMDQVHRIISFVDSREMGDAARVQVLKILQE
ncbi:hypothetical protein [Albidovulum sp.]